MTSHERRLARIAHEEVSFDPDHYLYVSIERIDMNKNQLTCYWGRYYMVMFEKENAYFFILIDIV